MGLLVTQMPYQPQHTFIYLLPTRMPAFIFVIPHLLCKALVWLALRNTLSFSELLSPRVEAVIKLYLFRVNM